MGGHHAQRILIGSFSAIAQLGLSETLVGLGLDVLVEEGEVDSLMGAVSEHHPHTVLLDLDAEGGVDLAQRISREFPQTKVILCSSEAPVMRVLPAFRFGASYIATLTPENLAAEMAG